MNEPLKPDTEVELLSSSGQAYARATITSRKKVRSKAIAKALGDYEYYVVGAHFGTWVYSRDLRPCAATS